jgi:hypothetical protein
LLGVLFAESSGDDLVAVGVGDAPVHLRRVDRGAVACRALVVGVLAGVAVVVLACGMAVVSCRG